MIPIAVDVNGETRRGEVEPRKLLVHFLRDQLELTGTHVGCDTGNCGACSVLVDGRLVKSCMMLAVQADGATIRTVEHSDAAIERLREAFNEHHALQCGYCTPGMLMNARALLEANPAPTADEIRHHLKGNLCRCTGYVNIIKAVESVAAGGADD